MNYFAHGCRFIDDAWLLAGTAVPDWMNVIDRRARIRARRAEPHLASADPALASLARGIVQHHRDDAWFHQTAAFVELSLDLTRRLRLALEPDESLRASFCGHVLVELLLDSALVARDTARLEAYYAAVESLPAADLIERLEHLAGRPLPTAGGFLALFCRDRFLWDYADDGTLLYRMNRVLRRVGLAELPPHALDVLPQARRDVTARAAELLTPELSGPPADEPLAAARAPGLDLQGDAWP